MARVIGYVCLSLTWLTRGTVVSGTVCDMYFASLFIHLRFRSVYHFNSPVISSGIHRFSGLKYTVHSYTERERRVYARALYFVVSFALFLAKGFAFIAEKLWLQWQDPRDALIVRGRRHRTSVLKPKARARERESECLRWNSKKKKTERWENVRKRITTWLKVSRDRHSLVTSYLIHSLILFSRLIIHFVNFDRCHTVSTLSHSLQQMFPLSPQATVREIERKKSTPLVCTVAHATLVAPNTEKLYQVWNRKTTFIANRCTVNFIVNNFIRRRCLHCVFTTLQCTVIVSQRALISSTL